MSSVFPNRLMRHPLFQSLSVLALGGIVVMFPVVAIDCPFQHTHVCVCGAGKGAMATNHETEIRIFAFLLFAALLAFFARRLDANRIQRLVAIGLFAASSIVLVFHYSTPLLSDWFF